MNKMGNFLRYELDRNIDIRRYTVIFIMYMLVVFNCHNVISRYLKSGVGFNFWDIVFFIFCSPRVVITIMIFCLIIINCDIIFDYNLETQVITRISSRKIWWNTKVAVLIINIVLCLTSLIFLTFILALRFPYKNEWSNSFTEVAKLNSSINLVSLNIVNTDAYTYKPLTIFVMIVTLMVLGYIAICMFMMIASIIFNKRLSSILAGVFIMILSLIPELQSNQTVIAKIIHNNLLLNTHSFNNINSNYDSIGYSIFIWILVISFLYYMGYRLSQKKNFYMNKS